MKIFAKMVMFAVIGSCVVGCGAAGTGEGAEGIDALEQDFGGPDGLMSFLEGNREDHVRDMLKHYGVGYQVHEEAETEHAFAPSEGLAPAIQDCPKYFPASDRSKVHSFNGEYYYIDSAGRPGRAYSYVPPVAAAPRVTSCQTSVGQWGDAENPSNDYDGGHMIGSQLGGWGARANLVPQDANFNRGNWVAVENKVAKCRALPSGRIRYQVSVGYSNGTALVPSTFGMQISNVSTSASVSLSFANTDGGGSNGTSEKNRGVTWLTNQGCN